MPSILAIALDVHNRSDCKSEWTTIPLSAFTVPIVTYLAGMATGRGRPLPSLRGADRLLPPLDVLLPVLAMIARRVGVAVEGADRLLKDDLRP